MRISTSMIHTQAVNSMLQAQTAMAKTQNEVSTGLKVQKPSDDPVAAVQILKLQQQQAALQQYETNIAALKTRLQTSEQALSDTTNALQRVSELAVQANNGSLNASDKQSIATELAQIKSQLLTIANTKDSNGEYLFAGFSSNSQPFSTNSNAAVVYSGDQGTRNVQIGASQYMADGNSGQEVFVSVPQGNGTFTLGANQANTGTGVVSGTMQNPTAWQAGNYTLSFTGTNAYQITDSASNVLATGTYTSGAAINFNGASITISGSPSAGDSFTISQSHNQDIFSTIDALSTALNSATTTPAQQAQYQNALTAVSTQISQAQTHISNVTTSIGTRLSALDAVDSTNQATQTQLTSALSGLQNADYTQSVSLLSQQYTTLQAAQQSYAKFSQLSLFNYL